MKTFLTHAFVVLALCFSASAADISKPNGNRSGGVFYWSNGGGDPYHGSLKHALNIMGVPAGDKAGIISRVNSKAPQRFTIKNGDRFTAMVSGRSGWVTTNVVARTSMWRSGRTRSASVWYYTNQHTGVQYRIIKPSVCKNWIVDIYKGPNVLNCRCHPRLGDAC